LTTSPHYDVLVIGGGINCCCGKVTTYRRLAESVLGTIESAIGRRGRA
jgi:glycerol-3-phosphate dehydrogenase